jgi:chromate transporter
MKSDFFTRLITACFCLDLKHSSLRLTSAGFCIGQSAAWLQGFYLFCRDLRWSLSLSAFYAVFHETAILISVFYGLKPVVLAIVGLALVRLSRRAVRSLFHSLLAVAAFLALFVFNLPFPLVILGAGFMGLVHTWLYKRQSAAVSPTSDAAEQKSGSALGRSWLGIVFACFTIWIGPVIWVGVTLGWHSTLGEIGVFFSKMAVVTFGGAYAVLSYVGQQAVARYGWLSPDDMINGLALAETTPGPLILVLSFVAFMAGYNSDGSLITGLVAGLFATLVTFAPCFLFIFTGAPFIERLRSNQFATHALSAITAAVVGVIANLSVWFALAVLFKTTTTLSYPGISLRVPVWADFDVAAFILSILALAALRWLRWNLGVVLVLGGLAGLAISFAF